MSYGPLYLIPTTLGETEPLEVLPISIKRTVEEVDHFIVENEKTARHFIKKIAPRKSQPALHIEVLNKFTEAQSLPSFLEPCLQGLPVGLLSEAGCPGIADPGADIVQLAHQKNIRVIPLVGPSSVLLAMMASGLNGQKFAFHGYLPIDKSERRSAIKSLERESREKNMAQIFIETPYRNDKLFEDLVQILQPGSLLTLAVDITLKTEYIRTAKVSEWKQKNKADLHKRPAIFILQSSL